MEEPKNCRKLKTLPVAKEYVEANRKIQQLNAVLFKLAKATAKTAWIYSTPLSLPDGSLGDIAFMVCEAIRRVADTTWVMCKRQLDSVHLVTLLTHYVSDGWEGRGAWCDTCTAIAGGEVEAGVERKGGRMKAYVCDDRTR